VPSSSPDEANASAVRIAAGIGDDILRGDVRPPPPEHRQPRDRALRGAL